MPALLYLHESFTDECEKLWNACRILSSWLSSQHYVGGAISQEPHHSLIPVSVYMNRFNLNSYNHCPWRPSIRVLVSQWQQHGFLLHKIPSTHPGGRFNERYNITYRGVHSMTRGRSIDRVIPVVEIHITENIAFTMRQKTEQVFK